MAPPSATQQSSPVAATVSTLRTDADVNSAIDSAASASAPAAPSSATGSPSSTASAFSDRVHAAEHRFTTLTQNIAHFSPLKSRLDKHNVAIERLEIDIKKKTALLQSCQDKLQGSSISLHTSEDAETETILSQQQATKESLDSLNGQLLAAKILHIGLTRQVAQYFGSRSELQALLEEIFNGSTPDHPRKQLLESELQQISADIVQVKEDFEKHRQAKREFKEIRRYVDIWNDAVEKQIASNPKDMTKSFKKFVPFLGHKPPSYIKIADVHMANARAFIPTLEDVGNLSDINMETIANTSSELIIYTAKFKEAYNSLSQALEALHKRSRVLTRKKNQCLEKLFDERCKIVSEELQAHYRSIGESLVGELAMTPGVEDVTLSFPSMGGSNGATGSRQPIHHRHHVENNVESYSSDGSTQGQISQELLFEAEELPSYFQYEQQDAGGSAAAARGTTLHRRAFSLGSPARSSSASSSLSLHSPLLAPITDSPPDYVRDEQYGPVLQSTVITTAAADEDEDAQFRAYHQRYDTRMRQNSDPRARSNLAALATTSVVTTADMPPGYDETRYHTVVDPV
ncbi:hypothetical protein BGZ99_009287 [Dissophora globulifera]|uniref:Uncharacterized protein n=1 Tax=Dissophora globulifera TaxID=979702 RepID=A0A9P6RTE4_9FUNG|nr:hypothetical protein BGZ99_009287 [Dissophora globulifera]